jgi:hypothetical protein
VAYAGVICTVTDGQYRLPWQGIFSCKFLEIADGGIVLLHIGGFCNGCIKERCLHN